MRVCESVSEHTGDWESVRVCESVGEHSENLLQFLSMSEPTWNLKSKVYSL